MPRAPAQVMAAPATVLPIENQKQLGPGMCWCAAVAPIIAFYTGRTISQHDLCDFAARRPADGATSADVSRVLTTCCRAPAYQRPPLSAETALALLANRQPIVAIVDVGGSFQAHVVCLRGMIRVADNWMAIINEPNFSTGISVWTPFARLRAAWRSSLIIAAPDRR